jgi:hypothetical protein
MPALWDRGMEIDQHLDAYMHMGGGCVKSIIITVRDCLTAAHYWKPFASIVNDNLLKKLHALQLDWLKITPFGGGEQYSLGGWVSEKQLVCVCKNYQVPLHSRYIPYMNGIHDGSSSTCSASND